MYGFLLLLMGDDPALAGVQALDEAFAASTMCTEVVVSGVCIPFL